MPIKKKLKDTWMVIDIDTERIVCGVDPSLNATGLVYLRDGCVEYGRVIECGIEEAKSYRQQIERLNVIKSVIEPSLQTYKPRLIAIEGYAFGPKGSRSFSIGELGGMLKHIFFDCGIPFCVIPPKRVKLFLTGNGNADKSAMMTFLLKHYDIDFSESKHGHDLVDATAIALIAYFVDLYNSDRKKFDDSELRQHEVQTVERIVRECEIVTK